jgi:rubrerythrin
MDSNNVPDGSRRNALKAGLTASAFAALSLTAINSASANTGGDTKHDLAILNAALDLENQAIWAYGVAAGKLSNSKVGNVIKSLALRNQADHIKHRDIFISTINSLGGTPVAAKSAYDVSAYIKAGEGNLDSDANIAKLALALEVDAVLAYASAVGKLKTPALIAAGLTILPDESAHAAAIRAVFGTLDATIHAVPDAQLSKETRSQWILTV